MLLYQFLPYTLCHTAQHSYYRGFAMFTTELIVMLKSVENFFFGILSYATSINENRICIIGRVAHFITRSFHDCGNDFGVCHVHLATIGLYMDLLCSLERFVFLHFERQLMDSVIIIL